VLWFRISRQPDDPERALGNFNYGKALILINRGDYFQAGLIVRKDSFDEVKSRGIDQFRQAVSQIAPYLIDRVGELHDWDQIKLLTVKINRLRQWYRPGLLCIGDAADGMAPAWGVVSTWQSRMLPQPRESLLSRYWKTKLRIRCWLPCSVAREFPTRVTQFLQVNAHRAMNRFVFENSGPLKAPWQLRLAMAVPGVQHLAGRFVGLGVRPEQIRPSRRERKVPAWPV
jgi:hypothetical protein